MRRFSLRSARSVFSSSHKPVSRYLSVQQFTSGSSSSSTSFAPVSATVLLLSGFLAAGYLFSSFQSPVICERNPFESSSSETREEKLLNRNFVADVVENVASAVVKHKDVV
jgi:hypothetical protein